MMAGSFGPVFMSVLTLTVAKGTAFLTGHKKFGKLLFLLLGFILEPTCRWCEFRGRDSRTHHFCLLYFCLKETGGICCFHYRRWHS